MIRADSLNKTRFHVSDDNAMAAQSVYYYRTKSAVPSGVVNLFALVYHGQAIFAESYKASTSPFLDFRSAEYFLPMGKFSRGHFISVSFPFSNIHDNR